MRPTSPSPSRSIEQSPAPSGHGPQTLSSQRKSVTPMRPSAFMSPAHAKVGTLTMAVAVSPSKVTVTVVDPRSSAVTTDGSGDRY